MKIVFIYCVIYLVVFSGFQLLTEFCCYSALSGSPTIFSVFGGSIFQQLGSGFTGFLTRLCPTLGPIPNREEPAKKNLSMPCILRCYILHNPAGAAIALKFAILQRLLNSNAIAVSRPRNCKNTRKPESRIVAAPIRRAFRDLFTFVHNMSASEYSVSPSPCTHYNILIRAFCKTSRNVCHRRLIIHRLHSTLPFTTYLPSLQATSAVF